MRAPLDQLQIGDSQSRDVRVAELFRYVGLRPEQQALFPHQFSGGQRQRIGIARALATQPDLIVCDEPVSALDVAIQAQILNLLRALQKEFGLTYLFISHDLGVVQHMCDEIAVMYLGQIVEQADRLSLFRRPRHPYTWALLSAVPSADPALRQRANRIRLTGDPPSPIDLPSGCRFASRCPFAQQRCCDTPPPLRPDPGWPSGSLSSDRRDKAMPRTSNQCIGLSLNISVRANGVQELRRPASGITGNDGRPKNDDTNRDWLFGRADGTRDIVACIRLAESLGYDSAWVAEGHGGDQFAILSAAATVTSRIALGTNITSVFVRTVPTIAMAAMTVDEVSQGRFILGVGSSHKVQVGPEHGMTYAKPRTRVRETVEAVRQLVRTGNLQFQGETINIEKFDLWFAPHRNAIPIYIAAVFPKMTELCGEIADGIILTRSTLETAGQARQHIAAGAERSGRNPDAVSVTTLLPTAVASSMAEARDQIRPGLALYAGFFPRYNKLIAAHGFEGEAADIARSWSHGDRDGAVRAVSDDLIDATSVAGTPEYCRERLEAYRQSGIDTPIISPFARGKGAKDTFERTIRACAPQ